MYYCHIAAHTHYFCNHHKDLCCILILSLSFFFPLCVVFFPPPLRLDSSIHTAIYSFISSEYVFCGDKKKSYKRKWQEKFLWLVLDYVNFTDICSFSNVCSSNKLPFTSWPFPACAIISGFSEIQCRVLIIAGVQCVASFRSCHFPFIQSLR